MVKKNSIIEEKLSKIHELRSKLKSYGSRPPFDALKEADKECALHGIDNWLVRCTDTQFKQANLNEFLK